MRARSSNGPRIPSAFATLWNWARDRPVGAIAGTIVIVLVLVVAIGVPIIRHHEVVRLNRAVVRASTLLVKALGNDAIFSGEPSASYEQLIDTAAALSRVHDGVVLSHIRFARAAQRTALGYTDYASRVGFELSQVAASQHLAQQSFADYEHAVTVLEASNIRNRTKAQREVTQATSRARQTSEAAYQECVLLEELTREFGITQTDALRVFPTLGPDIGATVASFGPRLEEAIQKAHILRKIFNPMARTPG